MRIDLDFEYVGDPANGNGCGDGGCLVSGCGDSYGDGYSGSSQGLLGGGLFCSWADGDGVGRGIYFPRYGVE
jgi:hypothetical protein